MTRNQRSEHRHLFAASQGRVKELVSAEYSTHPTHVTYLTHLTHRAEGPTHPPSLAWTDASYGASATHATCFSCAAAGR